MLFVFFLNSLLLLLNTFKQLTMKKYSILIIVLAMGFMFVNFNIEEKNIPQEEVKTDSAIYYVPQDVLQILDKSCYGCHNSESNNIKGKGKLKFDKMSELKLYKQVGKLTDIADVVESGDMPNKKFKKNYPDRMPTKEEQEKLISWARELAKQLTPAE